MARSTNPHRLSDEERAARLEQAHEEMAAAVADLATSEGWQRYLNFAGQLHGYSASNVAWLAGQAAARGTDLEAVAGYRKWQSLGRQVQKGEAGYRVIAPVTRKIEPDEVDASTGEPERKIVGWRVETVFDVGQTKGEPLPEKPQPVRLDGPAPAGLWDQIAAQIEAAGYSVKLEDPAHEGALGVTDFAAKSVAVRPDLPEAQRCKTLAHELAHVSLEHGNRQIPRSTAEIEAESVACLVMASCGVESGVYSVPYVAGWAGGDVEQVQATAKRVLATVNGITAKIDLPEPQPEPEIEAPVPTLRSRMAELRELQAATNGRIQIVSVTAPATPAPAPEPEPANDWEALLALDARLAAIRDDGPEIERAL